MRRTVSRSLGSALLWGLPTLAGDRPNLLVVYSDDHAQAAVGCYDSKLCETPHIDALAARGTRFTRSFVTNSICGPARAVFLTGLHSHANGQTTNSAGLREDLPQLGELLQAAGYQTGVIGKWHLPRKPRGFDHWSLARGSFYTTSFETAQGTRPEVGHSTDLITDQAIEWMGEQVGGEQPFFLWVNYHASHRVWDPSPEHLGLYRDGDLPEPATLFDDYAGRTPAAEATQMRIARDLFPAYDLKLPVTGEGILDDAAINRRKGMTAEHRALWDSFYGPENEAFLEAKLAGDDLVRWKYQRYIKDYLRSVAGIDAGLGRILASLAERGLSESTIVVYTSDQGFFLGEHGWYDKRWMYEPAFATPLVVAGPGITTGEVDDLVQNLDLAPTLLDLAGANVPAHMQGVSLGQLLAGEAVEGWRDAVYYEYHQRDSGRISHTVAPHYGVRTDRYKLLYVPDHDQWELYDLAQDPHEIQNLAGNSEYAGLQRMLTARLAELRERYEVSE